MYATHRVYSSDFARAHILTQSQLDDNLEQSAQRSLVNHIARHSPCYVSLLYKAIVGHKID
jgi:hypothetical protein